jgi:hypothetical protein
MCLGKRIDRLTDPDLILAESDVGHHCERCGCPTRYFYPVQHDDCPGVYWVGSECVRRLTLEFWRNQNGNYCASIGAGKRGRVTVFNSDHGLWWKIVFRNHFSRDFATAEEAMDAAYDFAMEVRHA